ncbi:MAG: RsmD family RNA methyltransferase [Acidobacteriota bacterium]
MKRGARIVGGRFGGRRLEVVPGVRPTSSRSREALANIWSDRLSGARLLDCFAGSGAMAVELIGRGVEQATLVERSPKVLSALRRNLGTLDRSLVDRVVELVRVDLPDGGRRLGGTFDLIFADPPYAFTAHEALLAVLRPRLASGGALVIEHGQSTDVAGSDVWDVVDRRRYGDTAMTFFAPV